MRKLLFLLFILFAFNFTMIAQEDTTDVWEDDEYEFEEDEDWNWNWRWNNNWFDTDMKGNPMIEVSYGLGKPLHKNLFYKPADAGLAEIKLGYSKREDIEENSIIKFSDRYLFVSNISQDLISTKAGFKEIEADNWRFGFAKRKGYGYQIGGVSILPYSTEGVVWSRIEFDYPYSVWPAVYPPLPGQVIEMEDGEILNRYEGNFRFGSINEAGIRFDIGSTLSLNAGYEATVVFPRWMFWKHLGSVIIEGAANGLLDEFIDEIIDSSPYAAPFVNFVLKNGLSYAFYSLKKDKMNWPFKTETPLTYETFKFGVTFTF